MKALAQLAGVEVRVVSPTPWVPPIGGGPKFDHYRKLPSTEVFDGLRVDRPRYPLPPKIGGYIHPQLMYGPLAAALRRIHRDFRFEMIDSHWVYPTGVAATRLGQRFNVPVCMTGRGEDMTRFPSLPLKGPRIRWALGKADALIGVSREICDEMVRYGAPVGKVATIANGVDTQKFSPMNRDICRQKLNLPADRPILLTVGDRLELKGFHLVIQALPKVLEKYPDLLYVCVGGRGRHGRDFTREIEACIAQHGLQDHVILPGSQDHNELPLWYNAANLYVLASSREGSPNVLLEALACGVPAVATKAGGAADEVAPPHCGRLVAERTPNSIAKTLLDALGSQWDCGLIRSDMEKRSWRATAENCLEHYRRIFSSSTGNSPPLQFSTKVE